MVLGQVERREFEIRIHTPSIKPPNNHIAALEQRYPQDSHIFVLDNLNTHQSEDLVRLVIAHDHLMISDDALRKKERSGVLRSPKTRQAFLQNPGHSVRFLYTSKLCSWLNQIECGFSIFLRRLLNSRTSCPSVEALEQGIQQFIAHYNEHLAKPFRWTFDGKLLKI